MIARAARIALIISLTTALTFLALDVALTFIAVSLL